MPPAAILVTQILLQDGVIPLWARRVRTTIAVLVVILLPILIYFTIQVVRVNFPDTQLSWLPHIISLIIFIPSHLVCYSRTTGIVHYSHAHSPYGQQYSRLISSCYPTTHDFNPQPPLPATCRLVHMFIHSARQMNGDWIWQCICQYLTQRDLFHENWKGNYVVVFRPTQKSFLFVYQSDYEKLLKSGEQFRVIAQADAYKGNKLTLKSLLRPSRENLYLVTQ